MERYQVILESIGEKKISLIQFYRELTGKDLNDARGQIESAPCVFAENLTKEQAEAIAFRLENEGAKATIKLYDHMESEETKEKESETQEYHFHKEQPKETNRAKKVEDKTLGALEKVSAFITSAVGVAAFVLLLIDFNGVDGLVDGLIRIFTWMCVICIVWFCVLKRYVIYLLHSEENSFAYQKEQYDPERFYEYVRDTLKYDNVEKMQLDENKKCSLTCKFGTHFFEYNENEKKMYVTYECSKGFPSFAGLCNMLEAACIAQFLEDDLYMTNEAEKERAALDKCYRLSRLGKLTPLYVILGIVLLAGPKELKKGIQTLRYPEIQVVKESSLPILGDAKTQKVLENFFGDPEWRFEKDGKDTGYVIFSGTAVETLSNMVRDVEIYFRTKRISKEEVQYEVQKITVEGEILSEEEMLALLLLVNGDYAGDAAERGMTNEEPAAENDAVDEAPAEESVFADEVTYFSGSYVNNSYEIPIEVSISQWSDADFTTLEAGEECASLDIYIGEDWLDATLIKDGYNFFTIIDNYGDYIGTLYVAKEYVEITDSVIDYLNEKYMLDHLYIS